MRHGLTPAGWRWPLRAHLQYGDLHALEVPEHQDGKYEDEQQQPGRAGQRRLAWRHGGQL